MSGRFNRLALAVLVASVATCAMGGLSDSPRDDFGGVFRMGSVYSFMAVFDFDEARVQPAVIDIGFQHEQTRQPGNACMITHLPGPGANVSCPSSLGDYTGFFNQLADDPAESPYIDHGNNMKNRIAATINDTGTMGVAGQVAVPNLYQFPEVTGFLYELDTAIARAVADRSTVVNISAGTPCKLLWNGSFTGDVCTPAGLAQYCLLPDAHSFSPPPNSPFSASAIDWLQAATPALKTALCAGMVGPTAIEGNVRQRQVDAVIAAMQQGVPVVASAGNLYKPLELGNDSLELTPMALADSQSWGILPGSIGQVITVGAVSTDVGYPNVDFHGGAVDIWAPSNDTSPAAAFVTGVVSLAQAIDPMLNPNNSSLSASQRGQIVGKVTALLSQTAYTSAHPDVSADFRRPRLVNPYGVVREAARNRVPAFESAGYVAVTDDLFSDNAENHPAGAPHWALDLSEQAEIRTGSIVYVPGATAHVDTDTYRIQYAGPHDDREIVLVLSYLAGVGELELKGVSAALEFDRVADSGFERHKRYVVRQRPFNASQFLVNVIGESDQDDNLYKLAVHGQGGTSAPGNPTPDSAIPSVRELERFVERMETAFPGAKPPELGCVTCNTLVADGQVTLGANRHVLAGKRGLSRSANALRFITVTKAGDYRVSATQGRAVRGLAVSIIDADGRVLARSSRQSAAVAATLKPGTYGVVFEGSPVRGPSVSVPVSVRSVGPSRPPASKPTTLAPARR